MELVRQFNSEMATIYEQKPPISKAKMASITRFAVKALKYYKHIVHSVEKYLHKCHPDYKLPGLYVLDSIIRQSRHQFGIEKDLFGPRFQKNIILLFQNIYQCPQEEKPKVVRVLNLWQRNGIYPPEVISPLVDMASTSSKVLAAAINKHKKKATKTKVKWTKFQQQVADMDDSNHFESFDNSLPLPNEEPLDMKMEAKKDKKQQREKVQMSQDDEIQVLKAQLEQQRKQQELLQQQLQMQIMATKQQALQLQLQQQQMQNKIQEQMQQSTIDSLKSTVSVEQPGAAALATQNNNQMVLLSQIQELTQQLEKDKAALASLTNPETDPVAAAAAALPQGNTADNHSQFLENFQQLIQSAKGIMLKDPRQQQQQQQLQQQQQHNNNNEEGKSSQEESSPKFNHSLLDTFEYDDEENISDEQRIQEQKNRLEEEQNRLKQKNRMEELNREEQNRLKRHGDRDRERERRDPRSQNTDEQPPQKKQHVVGFGEGNDEERDILLNLSQQDDDAMQIDNDSEEYNEDELYQPEQSLEEMERPWPPIEVNRREDRNVVEEEEERALIEQAARETAREEEKIEREKEEHWKKEKSVIPPPMMNRVTVASATLWIGRLPRGIHPAKLHEIFEEYGEVKNIDMIEMRGCAFVTMSNRFNADRALRALRRERIENCDVKMAWGQPKNLQEFSKFWDDQSGCSFIPWGAFKPFHLRSFLEGSIVDKDSLPPRVDLPNNTPNKAPPSDEAPPVGVAPLMPPRHPFDRMPAPGIPPHGMPPGMPHPDMMPPPPPMMPPGFRGQLPPMPIPGMLPLGCRPPMPPVGFPPWPGSLPPRPPGLPGNLQNLPKPPLLPADQLRAQLHNGRDGICLLPPPPPIPGAPGVRGPFPRPDDPGMMNMRPGFMPRIDGSPFNRPPGDRPRFPPQQHDQIHGPRGLMNGPRGPMNGPRGLMDGPMGRIEPPGLPPVPPSLQPGLWPASNIDTKDGLPQDKIPLKDLSRAGVSNENPEASKDEKDEKMERRVDQVIDQNREHRGTPDKGKDDRDRRSRDDYRDGERSEKKDNRRDERRDRDRDDSRRERGDRDNDRRDRNERDERRERDYRNERNRKGRDDERGERDYRRGGDDRDSRRESSQGSGGGSRDKYGKDKFGRDEFNRDEDRGRRDEFNRDEDRNRRDEFNRDDEKPMARRDVREEDKSRGENRDEEKPPRPPRRDRTPEKDGLKLRDSFKSDEVSSSSDKKELLTPLDIKGQGLSGFKSTMQPITGGESSEGKLSPKLPTVKSSGFKSTMQPVDDEAKPSHPIVPEPVVPAPIIPTPTEEYKTISPQTSKTNSKSRPFVPFSIFPFPNESPDDDDDENRKSESVSEEKELTSTKNDEMEVEQASASGEALGQDDQEMAASSKSPKNDDLYDPLEDVASPTTPETTTKQTIDTADHPTKETGSSDNLKTTTERVDETLSEEGTSEREVVPIATSNTTMRLPFPDTAVEDAPTVGQSDAPIVGQSDAAAPKVGQSSADIVTSSGDHSFSDNVSSNISPAGQSSGLVSSSVDPPFKEPNSKKNSHADNVTSSVDQQQAADTSARSEKKSETTIDTANNSDADMVPISSTTINSSDATNKPCSTVAVCESSDISNLNPKGSISNSNSSSSNQATTANENNLDCNKSPEYNSQVSTSSSTSKSLVSNNNVTSNSESTTTAATATNDGDDQQEANQGTTDKTSVAAATSCETNSHVTSEGSSTDVTSEVMSDDVGGGGDSTGGTTIEMDDK